MDSDGHFFSLATLVLALVLLIVLGLGGVFIYLFISQDHEKKTSSKLEDQ